MNIDIVQARNWETESLKELPYDEEAGYAQTLINNSFT